MSAILFGSISTIADTSELQRQAFNDAFQVHGLDWKWEQDDYRALLGKAGGRSRVEEFAASRGEQVDAAAVHATKSELFQRSLASSPVSPRPGVLETMGGARDQGLKLALVTTTAPENVTVLLDAIGLSRADFDIVVDSSVVEEPKPAGTAYTYALQHIGEQPSHCVAVEDNPDGVLAADGAGIACVAFPNENTAGQDFGPAVESIDALTLDALQKHVTR